MCGRGWGGGLKRDLEQEKGASCVRTSADFLEVSCDGTELWAPTGCVCVRARARVRSCFPHHGATPRCTCLAPDPSAFSM